MARRRRTIRRGEARIQNLSLTKSEDWLQIRKAHKRSSRDTQWTRPFGSRKRSSSKTEAKSAPTAKRRALPKLASEGQSVLNLARHSNMDSSIDHAQEMFG